MLFWVEPIAEVLVSISRVSSTCVESHTPAWEFFFLVLVSGLGFFTGTTGLRPDELERDLYRKSKTMVVSTLDDVKRSTMDTQPLKFGMDRILSEDISSKSNVPKEVNCTSTPPCAGCLTSLYRCCRNPQISAVPSNFYKTVIHAPQPLRPYTNVLIKADTPIPVQIQQPSASGGNTPRRKRSWSRAVFSNLQRKGLEKRFQLQKYITKPDRRQLAATLGLSDAQVKVWFQNRRMKWRHTKETPRQNFVTNESGENVVTADSTQSHQSDSDCGSDIDVQTVYN